MIRRLKEALRLQGDRHVRGFVFIHINKTAGSSIEKALGLRFEHRTAREKRDLMGERHWNRKFRFSFVRNPWDRIVSLYLYRARTGKLDPSVADLPFRDWALRAFADGDPRVLRPRRMFLPQWDWISDEEGKLMVDEVGRFENLAGDMARIAGRIGREVTLPHLKRSRRARYATYYDDETRELVGRWFDRDVREFDYRFTP